MSNIKVYTITPCPFCNQAKMLLTQNDIKFEEIHVDKTNQQELTDLVNKSGMRTFPQIFNGDELIGGFDELKKLHHEKGIKNVLK